MGRLKGYRQRVRPLGIRLHQHDAGRRRANTCKRTGIAGKLLIYLLCRKNRVHSRCDGPETIDRSVRAEEIAFIDVVSVLGYFAYVVCL